MSGLGRNILMNIPVCYLVEHTDVDHRKLYKKDIDEIKDLYDKKDSLFDGSFSTKEINEINERLKYFGLEEISAITEAVEFEFDVDEFLKESFDHSLWTTKYPKNEDSMNITYLCLVSSPCTEYVPEFMLLYFNNDKMDKERYGKFINSNNEVFNGIVLANMSIEAFPTLEESHEFLKSIQERETNA